MKKNLLVCAFFWSVLVTASQAQITITSANMPQAGNTYYMANDSNVTTSGSTGANQQWDFSNWSNHGLDTNIFVDPSTLPGYADFPSANLGLISSGGIIFLSGTSTAVDILGVYGDFGNGPSDLQFTPPQKFIGLPGTNNSTFSGNTGYFIEMPYNQPPIDSVRSVTHINYSSEFDAWGVLTTPAYSGMNCLRQKYTEIITDSIYVHMFGSWSPAGTPTIDTTVSYRWWSDSKDFVIAEIVTDGSGNVISASYQTTPPPPAQISFTANPLFGCAPLTVDFTNTSSDGVYYEWNFNDGSSYTGFDTIHTFINAGSYFVTLMAADSFGNMIGYAYTIIKVDGSAGYFEMADDSVCPGDLVNFKAQDGALDYNWYFGDGTSASGQQWESHAYTSTGYFNVSLVVTTPCGVDTIVQSIYVGNNVTPATGFYWWPNEICPNQPVNLYSFPVGNSYQWNFGDGNAGSGQTTTHAYPNLGTYTITCIVTNSCGNSSYSTGSVSVVSNAQIPSDAGLFHWPDPACPGTEIYFGAPSDMASYIWDFGDGSPADTSASNEVGHSFNTIGTYTVSVSIMNFCGDDTTLTTEVLINNSAPFTGWFDANVFPSPACPGSTVYFEAWGNDAVSYVWNFGDGSLSGNQSANHVYTNTGNYNASLTMTNSCGSDTTVYIAVEINNNVIPDPNEYDYGVAADTACSGDSILFYIAPAGSGTYLWNFGDGTSSSTSYLYTDGSFSVDIAPHVYANNGTYTVSFTLTNQCGNSFTDTYTVTIGGNVPVDGDMWFNGNEFCNGDTVKFNALGGASYVWNFGDGSAPQTTVGTITEIFHVYQNSGDFPVAVNITNSCGNSAVYSDTVVIDSCFVQVQEQGLRDFAFQIYPNPNKGKFEVYFYGANLPHVTQAEIYNIIGERIFISSPVTSGKLLINLTGKPSGIYFLRLYSEGIIYCGKVILE